MLLPFNSIPTEEPLVELSEENKNQTRNQRRPKSPVVVLSDESTTNSESESEPVERYIPPHLRHRKPYHRRINLPRLEESNVRSPIVEPVPSQRTESTQSTGIDLTASEALIPSVPHTFDSLSPVTMETPVETVNSIPSPVPPQRPVRQRKPPDRYGDWVMPIIATEDGSVEFLYRGMYIVYVFIFQAMVCLSMYHQVTFYV